MILHSGREGNDCTWKLRCHWIQILHSDIYSAIWPNFEVNGLDWLCCLASSSKMAPRILIFSIAMGAKPLFHLKSIATQAPYIVHITTYF